jgi:iron(III)-salmochelin esterase
MPRKHTPFRRAAGRLIGGACWLCACQDAPVVPPPVPSAPLAPAQVLSESMAGFGPAGASARHSQRLPASVLTWRFEDPRLGPLVVVVRIPERTPEQRFGVLFANHGRAEALKGPERGARGWLDDYRLERAIERLHAPPLNAGDFGGDITQQRLEQHNLGLERAPYHGTIVVMPFIPDALGRDQVFWAGPVLGSMVERELVPRIQAETPAMPPGDSWGIDGVSMGGRAALAIGFNRPQLFGWVGALQAAIDEKELARFVELAARARQTNPKQRLRLLSSEQDYYLDVNLQFHRRLENAGVKHDWVRVQGKHNYQFNRGPGAFEMLLDADRALNPSR